MFCVVVAVSLFMLTWNARRFIDNHYFLFLGIAFLFVGVIDCLDALTSNRWGGGGGRSLDINRYTYLWYAARYLQGVSIAIAPLFTVRKIRTGITFAAFFAVTAVSVATIYGGAIPDRFDSVELTPWIINANIVAVCVLGMAAFGMLHRAREHFDDEVFLQLSLSILFAVASGFTDGLGMKGFDGLFLLADIFKALSYYLVYKAVIETGLLRPYDLLFRNLKRNEEEARAVKSELEVWVADRKVAEQEREMTIDLLRLINGAKGIRELATGLTMFLRDRSGCESVAIRYRAGSEYPFVETHDFPDEYAHAGPSLCPAVEEGEPADRRNRAEFESLAQIPLRSGETTLGFLQFGDRRKGFFTPELIAKFERVAGHVAVALAQHLAEEALRESEDRFRSLVENAPVGILIVREGRILYRNPVLDRLFGEIPDGARFRDLGSVHPGDREKFDRLCEAIEQADPGWQSTELRFTLDEGDAGRQAMRWVFCQTGQIEFQGRAAALVVLDDMTRMKDLEQIVSTREKLSIMGQMAAGIAHEIRNPLSGININVSTLEHVVRNLEAVSAEERRKIGEIVAQAKGASEKIATVIRRVMDFTKPVPPKLDRVDVNQVVREALEFSSATLRKGGISVGTELSPGLPGCIADPRLLEQVLLNLITNAVQAMENGSGEKRLGVATTWENGAVLIRVFDNGPGVPVHLRERIFDPFYTTRKTGHGIGLSFSHRVIENHGGTLTASGSEWGGAEFRIALPLETGRATA